MEDTFGITQGGLDGQGHLGFAGVDGLRPFGPDVYNNAAAARCNRRSRAAPSTRPPPASPSNPSPRSTNNRSLTLAAVAASTTACGSSTPPPGPDAVAVVSSLGAVPIPSSPATGPLPTASATHPQLLAIGLPGGAVLDADTEATVTVTGPPQALPHPWGSAYEAASMTRRAATIARWLDGSAGSEARASGGGPT